MSYCRWSTDDFKCDLYCYEDVSGDWLTWVANSRHALVRPLPEPVPFADLKAWIQREAEVSKIIEESPVKPIGLAYDGKRFYDSTLPEFLNTLYFLRAAGYKFPDSVIEEVEQEIKEKKNENST